MFESESKEKHVESGDQHALGLMTVSCVSLPGSITEVVQHL